MIFLVGLHAVGKTEAGKEFAGADFAVVDTGPLMRQYHAQYGRGLSFGDWVGQGEAEHGPDYTNSVCVSASKCHLAQAAECGRETVIIGFRSLEGIRYFQHHVADPWNALSSSTSTRRSSLTCAAVGSHVNGMASRWPNSEGCSKRSATAVSKRSAASLLRGPQPRLHGPISGREMRRLVGLLQATPVQEFQTAETVLAPAS